MIQIAPMKIKNNERLVRLVDWILVASIQKLRKVMKLVLGGRRNKLLRRRQIRKRRKKWRK